MGDKQRMKEEGRVTKDERRKGRHKVQGKRQKNNG